MTRASSRNVGKFFFYRTVKLSEKESSFIKFGSLAVYVTTTKLKSQYFLLAYICMEIPYRIAKFKSANIFAIAILGSTTKFNSRQYMYFRLYGTSSNVSLSYHGLTYRLSFLKFIVPSGTPRELLVSHSLPTSAQLSWTPVPEDDTITGYMVQVEGPDSTLEIPVMDENATSYEVSDLRPYTTYTFSISVMIEAGTGSPISISSTTPQEGKVLCCRPLYYLVLSKYAHMRTNVYTHTHAHTLTCTYTHMHNSSLWIS